MIVARCETYVSAVCALSFHVSAHLCDVRPARRRTADGSCTAPRAGRCDISSSVVRLPWILQQHPRSSRPPPRKPAPPVPSLALLALAQALAACPPKTSSVLPLAQSSRSRLPRTRDASSESPPPPPPSPFRPPKPVRLFMGVALQRRTILVAGALAGVLGLTLLVSHASSAGSAAQAAGSSSSSPKWWDHLGVDIPSWSTGVGSAYAGAPVVCPEHADAGVPTLANAFVPIDDGAGRFVGKETRYLRGVPGYCELPRSLPRSPWPGSRARADPDLSLAALFENVYTMGGLMGAFDSRSSQNSSQLAGSSPRPPSPALPAFASPARSRRHVGPGQPAARDQGHVRHVARHARKPLPGRRRDALARALARRGRKAPRRPSGARSPRRFHLDTAQGITADALVACLCARQAARLVGTTIFINDGPGPEGYLGESARSLALAALILQGPLLTAPPPTVPLPFSALLPPRGRAVRRRLARPRRRARAHAEGQRNGD